MIREKVFDFKLCIHEEIKQKFYKALSKQILEIEKGVENPKKVPKKEDKKGTIIFKYLTLEKLKVFIKEEGTDIKEAFDK